MLKLFPSVTALALSALAAAQYAMNSFDFVVIGGGTCGLAVASRLSELKDISIAVIEAGNDERKNPNVTDPDLFTVAFGTHIDWGYKSIAQTQVGNRKLDYHSGKALGGSSVINGMTYIRADDVQIDAWEKIGNRGWNWETMYPYYKKVEEFIPPTTEQRAAGASYLEEFHGKDGPVHVGFPCSLFNDSFPIIANETWQHLGIPFNQDLNGGSLRGFAVWPMTLDRDANLRFDSARAYYQPVETKSNLKVFKGTASRIIWSDQTDRDGEAIAQGVEFVANDGTTQVVNAKREVIISAGSLRSPAILELSGVGNPDILNEYGIPTKIPLRAVGENLQDQPMDSIVYQNNHSISGKGPYVAYETASDIFKDSTDDISASVKAKLPEWATLVSNSNKNAISAKSLEYLFEIQHDLIFNKNVSSFETLNTASAESAISVFWGLLPFSRGSVHIGSSDPLEHPLINPNFYLIDWDIITMVEMCKHTRKYWSTEPASRSVVSEVTPATPNTHPVGTLAMMPKELGGVVDPALKVYGATNVRVVDASVMPFQVSGHLSSTLYAIAERAVDIIKGAID
ncbi:hypothetical protein FQN50_002288 [Emmonsiellopsis sp. PD_5]|nr:hypothetical protein FQN50_002288 [Emmonsiellopsis sp. PD_5]